MDQKTKAETFASLHRGADILVLPNAWDAASAAVMEDAGAKAVATSSAAVAWSHGYPDGDILPLLPAAGDGHRQWPAWSRSPSRRTSRAATPTNSPPWRTTSRRWSAQARWASTLRTARAIPTRARPQDRGGAQGGRRGWRRPLHQRPHRHLSEATVRGRGGRDRDGKAGGALPQRRGERGVRARAYRRRVDRPPGCAPT